MRFLSLTRASYQIVFLIAGIAIAIVVLGLAGSLLNSIEQKLQYNGEQRVAGITKQAANNVSDRITSYENALSSFTIQSEQLDVVEPALKNLKESFDFTLVAFVNSSGEGCDAEGLPFSASSFNLGGTQEVYRDINFSQTDTLVDGTLGRYAWKSLWINGRFAGTLYAGISSSKLLDKKQLDLLSADGCFMLFDSSTGTVIIPPNQVMETPEYESFSFYELLVALQQNNSSEEITQSAHEAQDRSEVAKLQRAAANDESTMFIASIKGKNSYVCIDSIGRANWYLCSIVPVETVRSESEQVAQSFGAITAVIIACLIAVLVMAFFYYRRRVQEKGLEIRTHLYGALSDSLDIAVNMYSPEESLVTPIVAKSRKVVGYTMAELMSNRKVGERARLSESGQKLLSRLRDGEIHSFEQGEFSLSDPSTELDRWVSYSVNPFTYEDKKQILIVFRDITAEKNMQFSMKDAMVAAETANHAKSDFLSRMSHEIRTPMNAIIGMATIAKNHLDDDERVLASLEKIDVASDHLLSLINDVLDISKIESGKMIISNDQFSLRQLVENTASVILAQCEQKNQEFAVSLDANPEDLYLGDRIRIQQLLINLLNNSVKYTPPGGHISFSVTRAPSKVRKYMRVTFVISDDGIGMSPEYLEHIFEPFVMEGRSDSEGTGLGMPIVKNIVTMMNGDIQLRSEINKGTAVSIVLNLERAEGEFDEPAFAKGESAPITSEAVANIKSALTAKTEKKAVGLDVKEVQAAIQEADPDDDYSLQGLRVLLAEDNDLNAEIAMELLSDAGIIVDWARDGEQACEMFSESRVGYYDVILMDIQMPILTGYQATEYIRSLEREDARSVTILAMSANAFIEDVQTSLVHGMDDHLTKPIDIRLVLKTIKDKMKNKGSR